ncbi:hypothetical protein LCGC14_0396580 [marine sediment metagenome]|uniref:Uncharacterized protein n=1 Tax=marine sediment metagenome TaxID=412755 RepID=A0A0F9VK38_9ZZZZ
MESLRQARERNLLNIAKTTSDEDAMLLQRISHRLHQLDEHACGYGLTARQEKRAERLEQQAQDIATKYNKVAYHQSDPRGWSLYLVAPQLNVNSEYDKGLAICPH